MAIYKTLVRVDYKTGIWDNCDAILEVRKDRRGGRIQYDYVSWCNNSGSLKRAVRYITLGEVRSILREIRLSRIAEARGDYHSWRPVYDIIMGA